MNLDLACNALKTVLDNSDYYQLQKENEELQKENEQLRAAIDGYLDADYREIKILTDYHKKHWNNNHVLLEWIKVYLTWRAKNSKDPLKEFRRDAYIVMNTLIFWSVVAVGVIIACPPTDS